MSHFLSFILPCYNYADIIEQSLASIYKQNLKIPFEVICTDDCSTDERTKEILRKWEKEHDNFHAYFHTENKGEGGACNTCIKHSSGDIFFCLDTDNVLVPDSINALIDLLDTTKCEGACFEKLRYFKEVNGQYVKMRRQDWSFTAPNNIVDIRHIISTTETPAASGNYLFTKESWERAGGYPENNIMGSYCFGFKQLATGSRIAVLPNTFYWHRVSDGGMYLTNAAKGNIIGEHVWRVVSEHLNIFTKETQQLLNTGNNKYNFISYTNSGRIILK
jgi:glycosyltransferase involved in cell wall biosynthesis